MTVPFIEGSRVPSSMIASPGDFVTPGSPIQVPEESSLGKGIHDGPNGPVAFFPVQLLTPKGYSQ
jgi:hypothetical protein